MRTVSSCATVDGVDSVELRRAVDADWPDIADADARAFAVTEPFDEVTLRDTLKVLPNDAILVARDTSVSPPSLVGLSAFYRMKITPPGGVPAPAAGLTWVSVAATHRRRGLLRRMLTDLNVQWEAEQFPFAILTATEATIYERFGFGVAMFTDRVRIEHGPAWRAPDTTAGSTRIVSGTQAAQLIPPIHARWAASHPGAITRVDDWWTPIFADRFVERRPGYTQLFYLVHDDGYAMYRLRNREDSLPEVEVVELVAVTPQAHSALWRILTSLDRTASIVADLAPDDPLRWLLTDSRAVRRTGFDDTVWVRILDVAKTLPMRRYAADANFVLNVADEFGSAGGRFAVAINGGVASVRPTEADADLDMTVATLSSLYFGGMTATELARAARIVGSAEALAAFDAAFATDRLPLAGTFF